jgi:hypothetical protein
MKEDSLFEIEETLPRWRELADFYGIRTWQPVDSDDWCAEYRPTLSFQAIETQESERLAVIALIHHLQLKGWSELSV